MGNGNTVATMKIKTVFDNSGLEKGVPGLKMKLKQIGEKLKSPMQTAGLLLKEAFKGVLSIVSGILGYLLKIGTIIFTTFAGGIIGKGFKEVLKDSESLRGNLQYIKAMIQTGINNIIQALLPTIQNLLNAILNTIYKILIYINHITMAWFGLDLFKDVSKTFAENMKKASGSASKIKKELQLAPFDEVNKLASNRSGGSGSGSATSFGTPNLTDMSNVKIPAWIQWIADNKDFIEKLAITAMGIFGVETIASWIKNIGAFLGSEQLGALGSTLGSLGLIAGGIIITYICAKQVWDDLKRLSGELDQIRIAGEKGQESWLLKEPDINQVFDTWGVNLYSVTEMYTGIENIEWTILDLVEQITGKESSRLKNAEQQTKNAKKQIDYMVQYYNKGKLTEEQQKRLIDTIRNQITENNTVIKLLEKEGKDTSHIKDINKELEIQLFAVTKGIQYNEKATDLWKTAQDGVNTEMDGTVDYLDKIQNTKIDDKKIKISPDMTDYYSSMDSIKKSKNVATVDVEAKTDKLKTGIIGAIGSALGSMTVKPIGIAGLGSLAGKSLKKILGLANGGIVNNPGAGVPIASNVIAGERGAEAVIPLNDETMDRLGQSIAKYVKIDNLIDFSIDSYRINRIMKQSDANNKFAGNR